MVSPAMVKSPLAQASHGLLSEYHKRFVTHGSLMVSPVNRISRGSEFALPPRISAALGSSSASHDRASWSPLVISNLQRSELHHLPPEQISAAARSNFVICDFIGASWSHWQLQTPDRSRNSHTASLANIRSARTDLAPSGLLDG